MKLDTLIRREKKLWHEHFLPSLIAGIAVALVAYLYEATLSNIFLFASVGASSIILSHSQSHHLTRLRTTIEAYIIAISLATIIYYINVAVPLHIAINMFLVVFFVGMALYLFDTFHPPAITAALSFILLERSVTTLLLLFTEILVLLIIVRFLAYTVSQHLSIRDFLSEFRRLI